MYDDAGVAFGSSTAWSGKSSLFMLVGVFAESSATMKGWLSDEACLGGVATPELSARLSGREKLKDGLGRPAETSDARDGDLVKELVCGEEAGFAEKALLLDDSWRGGCEWNDEDATLPDSSVPSIGDDVRLDDRFAKSGRGGASVLSKEAFLSSFSGDWFGPVVADGASCDVVSFRCGCGACSMGVGDSSLRRP